MKPNLTVREPDLSTPDLNSAPHDADQLASSERILPLYRVPLGDAIFPGDDIHTVRMRSDFSEMLLQHAEEGGALDMKAIAATLARFTPARVATATTPTWKEREVEDWSQRDRMLILRAMEKYFSGGGLERRSEEIRTFFASLHTAGIQLGNTSFLFERVYKAGNWREEFTKLVTMGRQHGVRLSCEFVDRSEVDRALRIADFSKEQQHMIWGSLHETRPLVTFERSPGQSRWRTFWKRLLSLAPARNHHGGRPNY